MVVLLGNTPPLPVQPASPAVDEVVPRVGTHAPVAPGAPELNIGPATLETVRRHMEAGDTTRALHSAQAVVDTASWGRERDAALMVVGLIHREAGRHNLASEAFTVVRSAKGSLAPLAAFYEAEQDLVRGREWVAVRECETYRTTWPSGDHAAACLRVIATGYARLGKPQAARAAAASYDDDHENGTITEQIDLILARGLAKTDPDSAVRPLQRLAVQHNSPLTGRVAEELLADLYASGHTDAVIPTDLDSRKTRAISLRDVKRKDDAWAAFEALMDDASEDPSLQRWVETNAERFGWRTHRWDYLAKTYGAAYAEDADADLVWSQFRVLGRGGRHADAAEIALTAQKTHSASREWRRKEEQVGQTLLLAGRYPDAVAQFDALAARGGWNGRRGRFFAAFAALMAGEAEDAVARFTTIIDADRGYLEESHYWRAKAYALLEQSDAAQADQAWVLEQAPRSWYAVLLHQGPDAPTIAPLARSGAWVGPPPQDAVVVDPVPLPTVAASSPALARPLTPSAMPPSRFGHLGWSPGGPLAPGFQPTVLEQVTEVVPPPSYRASPLHEPERAGDAMTAFAAKHGKSWPELHAIRDLASVGLYDLSGTMMSEWFERWKKSYRSGNATARRVQGMETGDWRRLFLFTRDHHHSARFTYEWWDSLSEPAEIEESWRLAHPLAHAHTVWTHGRTHGIDPYMVLGLMRQESTYNAVAVSRVGASGAMQIMPTTGHLLADLAHDVDFTAGDLEDPELSIGYGITYLGLLMERFEGVYPLAVASYNGGPHNVSAWLQGTGTDMPIDAFVEHIPYRETRDYVKKVSSGYQAYVELYGPDGAAIVVPPTPKGDHPEVVDF